MRSILAGLLVCLLAVTAAGCGGPSLPSGTTAYDPGVDPETWVRIPAGPYLAGQYETPAAIDTDYQIMVTDVTNAQYAAYVNDALAAGTIHYEPDAPGGPAVAGYYPGDAFHGHRHEERIDPGDYVHFPTSAPELRISPAGGAWAALPGYENHPMTMVTWFGVRAYCEFIGARLPTQAEWEKAARGADDRPFPWGFELARNRANYYNSSDIFEKALGKAGDTTPVGFYNGKSYDGYPTLDNASPYGLYDMAGNVWQWTADITEGIHYRYLRGGSKADYGYMLRVWTRNNARPDYYGPNVGFRCACDAGCGRER